MDAKIRWGILGTGSIAHKFAHGLKDAEGADLAAVGSRSQASADAFGHEFDIPRRHGSYADLAGDDNVDVIYIATPHPMHKENALLSLRAGKAVLCEKPFTVNARQANSVIDLARRNKLFVMEAMWTRFYPLMDRLRRMLSDGAIGEVRMVQADFAFRATFNPQSRLFDPALGGGGLLDVGVYTVSLASMILGRAEKVTGLAEIGQTGVDEQAAVVLGYAGGPLAVLSFGVRTTTPHEATIYGTDGWIRIHSPWWKPTRMTLRSRNDEQLIEGPVQGDPMHYEADEVMACLRAGKTESDVMPLDESLAIMETMDEIRSQWRLKYPVE